MARSPLYIGCAKLGSVAFFESANGELLIEQPEDSVDRFIGASNGNMMPHRRGSQILVRPGRIEKSKLVTEVEFPIAPHGTSTIYMDDLIYIIRKGYVSLSDVRFSDLFGSLLEGSKIGEEQ